MFDLLFVDATVVDGTGRPRYQADLGVQGDTITDIGNLKGAPAERTINAKGLALTPGFIDIHSHADIVPYGDRYESLMEPLLRQGITTFVGGNCGLGLAPVPEPHREFIHTYWEAFSSRKLHEEIEWDDMAGFIDFLTRRGTALNIALLTPHAMLRIGAVGTETRHAHPDETAQMARWLEEALDQGSIGMSTGLQYFPGSQSHVTELIDLARVLSRKRGVFTSHLRSYSATLPQAIDEVALVGSEADVPIQISHLFWIPDYTPTLNKLMHHALVLGSEIHKRVKLPLPLDFAAAELLQKIHQRRESGEVSINIDAMPTSAGFTHLLAFFPPYIFNSKNKEELIAKLRDKKMRKRIRRDIEKGDTKDWPHDGDTNWSMNFFKMMGWTTAFIMSVGSEKNRHLEGMNLVEIGKMWKMHPFDAAVELLLQEDGKVLVFETATYPGDDFVERSVYASISDPNVSIVTDSILMGYGRPSHLFYDCYPKFFQRYVRETGMVSLETGVRKCSGLSADSMGLPRRGYLKRNYFADLVLFDPDTIRTNSSFEKPDVYPDGIKMVVVNGQVVVDGNRYLGDKLAGAVVTH